VGNCFVAGNVKLDLAGLNKVETLLWDSWGVRAEADAELTDEVVQLYDRASDLTADAVDFDQVRELFATDDRLRVPATLLSNAPFNGPTTVALRP
jgi:hypothetical protein